MGKVLSSKGFEVIINHGRSNKDTRFRAEAAKPMIEEMLRGIGAQGQFSISVVGSEAGNAAHKGFQNVSVSMKSGTPSNIVFVTLQPGGNNTRSRVALTPPKGVKNKDLCAQLTKFCKEYGSSPAAQVVPVVFSGQAEIPEVSSVNVVSVVSEAPALSFVAVPDILSEEQVSRLCGLYVQSSGKEFLTTGTSSWWGIGISDSADRSNLRKIAQDVGLLVCSGKTRAVRHQWVSVPTMFVIAAQVYELVEVPTSCNELMECLSEFGRDTVRLAMYSIASQWMPLLIVENGVVRRQNTSPVAVQVEISAGTSSEPSVQSVPAPTLRTETLEEELQRLGAEVDLAEQGYCALDAEIKRLEVQRKEAQQHLVVLRAQRAAVDEQMRAQRVSQTAEKIRVSLSGYTPEERKAILAELMSSR
jgi:hypothetical protein